MKLIKRWALYFLEHTGAFRLWSWRSGRFIPKRGALNPTKHIHLNGRRMDDRNFRRTVSLFGFGFVELVRRTPAGTICIYVDLEAEPPDTRLVMDRRWGFIRLVG